MAMERLLKLAVVTVDVVFELGERKGHVTYQWRHAPGLHICDGIVIGIKRDRLPFHHVARPEHRNNFGEVADLLRWVIDGHRGDPKHLVPAGAAHRINATETAAVTDGE